VNARLEHANLIVRELDAMLHFLHTAFPEFVVRAEGLGLRGERWLHVGTDETYLALNAANAEAAEVWVPYAGKPGLNHLGFEVDDADALRERMREAGYFDSTVPNAHSHRKRVYFHDAEGHDWPALQSSTKFLALGRGRAAVDASSRHR
jgi:catechol 2,3-dioxygenase-like lactoylglutathione lyase family enzyme